MTTIFTLPFDSMALAPLIWALGGLVGSQWLARRRPAVPLATRDERRAEALRPAA